MKLSTINTGTAKAQAAASNYSGIKIIGTVQGGKFNNNLNGNNCLNITTNLTAKMQGMTAITTSPYMNNCCKARLNNNIGVCAHCFSAAGGSILYPAFIENTVYNSIVLSANIIDPELLPRFTCDIVRLESHGDLINKVHAINYFNICNVNPGVKFTLWTKNPGFIQAAINSGYSKPVNLTIIASSIELNTPAGELLKKYNFIDKIFTVYTAAFAIANNVYINCGNKHCITCRACYSDNDTVFINEILKSDLNKFINAGGVVNYR